MRYTTEVISYSTSAESAKELSLVLRQSTVGPELDIVLEFYREHLEDFATDADLTVFVEPKLESGFPDLVVVFWNKEMTERWTDHRSLLIQSDILLMHHLNLTGAVGTSELVKRFGKKKASETMLRMEAAGVANVDSEGLISKPLNEVFAINRLVAIEAKVRDWKSGIDQAVRNTWFASESYLLLGFLPNSESLYENAKHFGVGILDHQSSFASPHLHSKVGPLPVSYASWLFNEWVWKHHRINGHK